MRPLPPQGSALSPELRAPRSRTSVAASAASLKVYAPSRVRGGLFYEARFTIEAKQDLENATLVLDPGWAEGITINTVEPSPVGEASRNGDIVSVRSWPSGRSTS
jgi:hypothetical protein